MQGSVCLLTAWLAVTIVNWLRWAAKANTLSPGFYKQTNARNNTAQHQRNITT